MYELLAARGELGNCSRDHIASGAENTDTTDLYGTSCHPLLYSHSSFGNLHHYRTIACPACGLSSDCRLTWVLEPRFHQVWEYLENGNTEHQELEFERHLKSTGGKNECTKNSFFFCWKRVDF